MKNAVVSYVLLSWEDIFDNRTSDGTDVDICRLVAVVLTLPSVVVVSFINVEFECSIANILNVDVSEICVDPWVTE